MAHRTDNSKWYWVPPLLLMIFPALVLIAWWRWAPPTPVVEERSPPPPMGTSARRIDEPSVAEEPPVSPPPLASAPAPPVDVRTTMDLKERPSPPKKRPARGDVSDAALADFDPETIAMLNSHKYWSVEKQELVDGLYDQWLNAKQQGADVEDIRRQIAWALEGRFMEKY